MKRVVFITPECFVDVDIPVVIELNKRIELLWIVTFSTVKSNDQHIFSPEQISEISLLNKIVNVNVLSPYRVRDPRRIGISLQIIKTINNFSPDLIYFNSFFDPYLAICSRLVLDKRKMVVALHDVELHPGSDSTFRKLSNFIILNSFRHYHVFSKSQAELFKKSHPGKSVFVIDLFLKDFGNLNKRESKSKKTNFLFFGTDHPYKGLDLLIEASEKLSKNKKDFIVTVAGKCENFDRFRNLISDNNIFNLNLKFIRSEDIPDFFTNADFIVLPYRQVTQSGPLMVAMRYNVPAIASDLPGFRELIKDGETGFLFECGNSSALSGLMEQIIEMNTIQAEKMKNNLHKFIDEKYKIELFVNMYLDMFSSVSQRNQSF